MRTKIVCSIHLGRREIVNQVVNGMPFMEPVVVSVDRRANVVLSTRDHEIPPECIIGTYTSNARALCGIIAADLEEFFADRYSAIPPAPANARSRRTTERATKRCSQPIGSLANIVDAHLAIMYRIRNAQHGGGTTVWSDESHNLYASHSTSASSGRAERDTPGNVIGTFCGSVKSERILELLYEHQQKRTIPC